MQKFKEGDLVRLKAGGPVMVVEGRDSAGLLICSWFVGPERDQERRQDSFEDAGLVPADSPGQARA